MATQKVSDESMAKIKDLAELHEMSQKAVVDFLLDMYESGTFTNIDKKTGEAKIKEIITGRGKAEKQLKVWLHAESCDFKITASKLRMRLAVDLNSCKDVIQAYEDRVNEHNKKFE